MLNICIPPTVSKKYPRIFWNFSGNSRAQKSNIARTNTANITGVKYYFHAYRWVVSTLLFILFILFILLPRYLYQFPFLHTPLTLIEYTSPLSQTGTINSNTVFAPRSEKSLTDAEPLHQTPHFRKRINRYACHCFRQRPPFPLTLAICCRHHRL